MHFAAIQVDTGWLWVAAVIAVTGIPLLVLCWASDRSRERRWHEERHYARQGFDWDAAIEAQAYQGITLHAGTGTADHNGKQAGVFDYEAEDG